MSKRKVLDSITNLENAMFKLKSALKIKNDRELVIEGTIQRFEIVIELMWKTLKRALQYEGIITKTPRESLQEAFKIGWLHNESAWLDMLDKRNTSSHVYLHEQFVEEYYKDIKECFPELNRTFQLIKTKYLPNLVIK